MLELFEKFEGLQKCYPRSWRSGQTHFGSSLHFRDKNVAMLTPDPAMSALTSAWGVMDAPGQYFRPTPCRRKLKILSQNGEISDR